LSVAERVNVAIIAILVYHIVGERGGEKLACRVTYICCSRVYLEEIRRLVTLGIEVCTT
jgi:hypothetical protein